MNNFLYICVYMDIRQEFIICSAIWIKDSKSYEDNPINISTGLVVSGRRNNNCFSTFKLINPNFNFTKDNDKTEKLC